MALLGPTYPEDPDQRGEALDQADLDDRLHELDERFYTLEAETNADRKLNAFVDGSSAFGD